MALSEARHWPSVFDEGVPRRELRSQGGFLALWAGVTAVGAFLHPNSIGHGTHEFLGLPPCPSVVLFDRPCPGCGLTTSWTALIHGDFTLAFHAHPLGPLLYVLFTVTALLGGYGYMTYKRLRTYTDRFGRIAFVCLAGFLIFGATRFALTPHFAANYEKVMYELGTRN